MDSVISIDARDLIDICFVVASKVMAYSGTIPAGPNKFVDLSGIVPYRTTLRNGAQVVLQHALVGTASEDGQSMTGKRTRVYATDCMVDAMRQLLNEEIMGGQTYPFETPMDDAAFRTYFCGYDVFILRRYDEETESRESRVIHARAQELVGCFYIKPNFPGRSSHICNAGFLVAHASRGSGAGRIMGERFRHLAKALGYRGSLFNLVYRSNAASNHLWAHLGFVNVATIPGAGRLTVQLNNPQGGETFTDALMWFFDLTVPNIPYLPAPWEPSTAGVVRQPPATSRL